MIEERGHKLFEFGITPTGALHLWKRPERGKRYILGGNPAKGMDVNSGVGTPDPDYAVGQIFDAATFEQVAMLRERLTPSAFARYIYDLGQWYKPLYVVIEVETNGGNGSATVVELRQLDYPLHLIHQMQVIDHATQRQTDILGYQISSRTKPQLMSNWGKLLYERVVNLHCPITLAEHRTFVHHPNGSVGAERGRHDDTVTGCMLAGIGMTQAQGFKEVPVVGPTGESMMPFVGRYGMTMSERVRGASFGHKAEKRDYEREALTRERRKLMRG